MQTIRQQNTLRACRLTAKLGKRTGDIANALAVMFVIGLILAAIVLSSHVDDRVEAAEAQQRVVQR